MSIFSACNCQCSTAEIILLPLYVTKPMTVPVIMHFVLQKFCSVRVLEHQQF